MRPKEQHPVQSPYVVVLGGNSVRRKATPPPDATHHHEEKPEPQVYGVLPPLKTMAKDTADVEAQKLHHITNKEVEPPTKESTKKWWSLGRTDTKKKNTNTPEKDSGQTSRVVTQIASKMPPRVIDVPSPTERTTTSPFRSRFMRGIAKKGYLTSKLTVELPFHAKVGMGIAVLALIVGLPVISRFVEKPAPVTAGTIVAIGTEALVAQVSRSIELPGGETPLVVIATADDIRRLNVPDAKPGNKVLLYQQAGKIVVYDAESDKVLGVVNRSQP